MGKTTLRKRIPKRQTLANTSSMNTLMLPTREQIKALIRMDMWYVLGKTFDFNPVFILVKGSGGRKKNVIDWACVPPAMYKILQCRDAESLRLEFGKNGINTNGHPRRILRRNKRELLHEQQGGRCHYCQRLFEVVRVTVDHVIPLSKGGKRTKCNEVGACSGCNNAKGNLMLIDFLNSDYVKNGFHKRK